MFLCTEELTRQEAMKSASFVLPSHHHVKSVTDGHFVSCDLLIHYLNWAGMMDKMAVRKKLIGDSMLMHFR